MTDSTYDPTARLRAAYQAGLDGKEFGSRLKHTEAYRHWMRGHRAWLKTAYAGMTDEAVVVMMLGNSNCTISDLMKRTGLSRGRIQKALDQLCADNITRFAMARDQRHIKRVPGNVVCAVGFPYRLYSLWDSLKYRHRA